MKKIYIGLFAVMVLLGCKKYQQDGPLENFTEDLVFDPSDVDGTYAEQYLFNIYSKMPNGFNRVGGDFLDAATDDAIPSRDGANVENLGQGRISPVLNNPDGSWTTNYSTIRSVNVFLANIDVVPAEKKIVFWKPEARFLRALAYFELLKRYGGVPLIGAKVYNGSEPIQLKRNTFAETVDYIVKQCDSIKDQARKEPLLTTDWGKVSRGAVLALKSRVLLYAASPLFNGNAGKDATQAYPNYDVKRWEAAANAALELIQLPGAPYNLPSDKTFNNIFLDRSNSEIILSYLRLGNYDIEYNNGPVGFANQANGNGYTSPTQDLVDAFPMDNGKSISEEGSGYDRNNPFANRDPRLGFTVLTNDATWLNRKLQMYEGGLDKPNKGRVQTKTGYYLRKFMGNFSTSNTYSNGNRNFILFRYAEILLNFAEAQNEFLAAPSPAVYNVLRDLRKRAKITEGTTNKYGIKDNMTKAEMREAIKKERRIELAFEEHRYWDLRRWKDAEQVLNKTLTGMKITKNANNTFTYERVPVGNVSFAAPRMYLYPIPSSEVTKNDNLIQNNGW